MNFNARIINFTDTNSSFYENDRLIESSASGKKFVTRNRISIDLNRSLEISHPAKHYGYLQL
jgi:hypothetical protein